MAPTPLEPAAELAALPRTVALPAVSPNFPASFPKLALPLTEAVPRDINPFSAAFIADRLFKCAFKSTNFEPKVLIIEENFPVVFIAGPAAAVKATSLMIDC